MASAGKTDNELVTRFAPSPSGALHLGHAFAAIVAHDMARAAGGRFHVRMEDIDRSRCRREYEDLIFDDLHWLGLSWETPVLRQSHRLAHYRLALDRIAERGLLYPCFCTRKAIAAEIERSSAAPHGPHGPVYPGTCKRLSTGQRRERVAAGLPHALRLDMASAIEAVGALPPFRETGRGPNGEAGLINASPAGAGDIVLARKDIATSYHLAVVCDDAAEGITVVTRGEDLFAATTIHCLLQRLLNVPTPCYHHHRLIRGPRGERLATRVQSETLAQLRQDGETPESIRKRLGITP